MFQTLTYKYRIKDSNDKKYLSRMAGAVNFVWNYCNETSYDSIRKNRKWLSGFDLNNMTSGCGKALGLPATTIQEIGKEYALKRKQFKKNKLNWRTAKRKLGWIPVKSKALKLEGDKFRFNGRWFSFWNSRPIDGKIGAGSITQDSRGNWFIQIAVTKEVNERAFTGKEIGVDLGLKTIAVTSEGEELGRPNYTKQYAAKLAMAQRANKKKRVTTIHTKIKNKRRDWEKKTAARLCEKYDKIVVGDVSSSKLMKTKMAKSVTDASWYGLKLALGTTAIKRGVDFHIVKESFSTVTCSSCSERTGPSGLSGLGVREWECSSCGTLHDRDTNAAKNILSNSVQDIAPQLRESPLLQQGEDVNMNSSHHQ